MVWRGSDSSGSMREERQPDEEYVSIGLCAWFHLFFLIGCVRILSIWMPVWWLVGHLSTQSNVLRMVITSTTLRHFHRRTKIQLVSHYRVDTRMLEQSYRLSQSYEDHDQEQTNPRQPKQTYRIWETNRHTIESWSSRRLNHMACFLSSYF